MKVRRLFISVFTLTCCVCLSRSSQAQDKPLLTNCDIYKMLQAKLPESTIQQIIGQNSGRFILSEFASKELEKVGATPTLLTAMREAAISSTAEDQEMFLATLPCQFGYYYKANDGWLALDAPKYGDEIDSKTTGVGIGFATFGLAGFGHKAIYKGKESNVKIAESQPTLYLQTGGGRNVAADILEGRSKLVIVQLEQKDDKREIDVSPKGINKLDRPFKYRPEQITEVILTRISGDLVTVSPKTALTLGEYVLTEWTLGKYGAGGYGYDFSIVAKN